jgi:hypothetical protein
VKTLFTSGFQSSSIFHRSELGLPNLPGQNIDFSPVIPPGGFGPNANFPLAAAPAPGPNPAPAPAPAPAPDVIVDPLIPNPYLVPPLRPVYPVATTPVPVVEATPAVPTAVWVVGAVAVAIAAIAIFKK